MGAPDARGQAERIAALERELETLRGEARTRTWVPPGHYYSPIPDPAQVRARAAELFFRRHRELPGIDLNFARQEELLRLFVPFYAEQPWDEQPDARRRYGFANAVFTGSKARFEQFFTRTRSGILNSNRSTNLASAKLPFGGVGKSGNYRPAGAWAHRNVTVPVAVTR